MVLTTPDEKAIAMEREELLKQIESLQKQIKAQAEVLQIAHSDNEMLKDTIVRLAMKTVGVRD